MSDDIWNESIVSDNETDGLNSSETTVSDPPEPTETDETDEHVSTVNDNSDPEPTETDEHVSNGNYASDPEEPADEIHGTTLVVDNTSTNETGDTAGDDTTVAESEEPDSTGACGEELGDTIVGAESEEITESGEGDLSDVDLAEYAPEPVRRSGRNRCPTKTLSYDTRGNPVDLPAYFT